MATARTTAASREKAIANKIVQLAARNKCVPLDCKITGGPCAYLVKCNPMSCGGLECPPLKKV